MTGLVERVDGRAIELVYGDSFVAERPTPYLERVISNAAQLLRRALEDVYPGCLVEIDVEVMFDPRTVLRPDVVVRRGEDSAPGLVLEVRSDSTDRYALGPKRLVYSRGRIPEYCFVDPAARLVRLLRYQPGSPDYPWPPTDLGPADVYELAAFPGVSFPAGALLAPAARRASALAAADGSA